MSSSVETKGHPAGGSVRRILVVDDSRLQRRILSSSLKKWGFDVVEADSADRAMDICADMSPDFILSDWMMPGMNGLEFCRAFRALPLEGYGYFILLTSKSAKNEIAEGLDAGADDFLTKPVNPHELRARIAAGERILGMQRELSEKNRLITKTLDQLQSAYDTIDKDLIQAKKIQKSLVPELTGQFGTSRVSLLLKPCGHIGGDLVGMFSADENNVAFYSIDVSGHGITSAMMTARLGGYLSGRYFDQNIGMERLADGRFELHEPQDVARRLNERLMADGGTDEYFTMAYATIDLRSGELCLVQAGHPHPLLIGKDGQISELGNGGMPIGLLDSVEFDQFRVTLEPGEQVLMHSDGFTECRLESGEMLDTDGLTNLIRANPRDRSGVEFLDDLFWTLTQTMSSEFGMEDDVSATLFEFERN